MDSYFIRHTKKVSVRDEDLDRVWNQNEIAIHYSGDDAGPDAKSVHPEDYDEKKAKKAIRLFKELSEAGGCVWAESRGQINANVGMVKDYRTEKRTIKLR